MVNKGCGIEGHLLNIQGREVRDGETCYCATCAEGDKVFGGPEWRDGLETDYKALVLERWPDAECVRDKDGYFIWANYGTVDEPTQAVFGPVAATEPLAWKSAYERMGE